MPPEIGAASICPQRVRAKAPLSRGQQSPKASALLDKVQSV